MGLGNQAPEHPVSTPRRTRVAFVAATAGLVHPVDERLLWPDSSRAQQRRHAQRAAASMYGTSEDMSHHLPPAQHILVRLGHFRRLGERLQLDDASGISSYDLPAPSASTIVCTCTFRMASLAPLDESTALFDLSTRVLGKALARAVHKTFRLRWRGACVSRHSAAWPATLCEAVSYRAGNLQR